MASMPRIINEHPVYQSYTDLPVQGYSYSAIFIVLFTCHTAGSDPAYFEKEMLEKFQRGHNECSVGGDLRKY
jgi:hypothetical protein